jgi:hypothetical protein
MLDYKVNEQAVLPNAAAEGELFCAAIAAQPAGCLAPTRHGIAQPIAPLERRFSNLRECPQVLAQTAYSPDYQVHSNQVSAERRPFFLKNRVAACSNRIAASPSKLCTSPRPSRLATPSKRRPMLLVCKVLPLRSNRLYKDHSLGVNFVTKNSSASAMPLHSERAEIRGSLGILSPRRKSKLSRWATRLP